jgi:hypothetical protein
MSDVPADPMPELHAKPACTGMWLFTTTQGLGASARPVTHASCRVCGAWHRADGSKAHAFINENYHGALLVCIERGLN